MSMNLDGDLIRAIADEFEEMEAVAEAAELYMRRIAGLRVVGDDGQPTDLMHAKMPEARALEAALKQWRPDWRKVGKLE